MTPLVHQADAFSLLKPWGIKSFSQIAINNDLFFNGASCGTCILYRSGLDALSV